MTEPQSRNPAPEPAHSPARTASKVPAQGIAPGAYDEIRPARRRFGPAGTAHDNPAQGIALGIRGSDNLLGNQALKGRHKRRQSAMSQALAKNLIHLIYSTKRRQPWLTRVHRDRLFAYQAGVLKQWNSPAIVINGVDDHVHSLFVLSKNHALIKVVEEVKKASSKWMKADGPKNPDFFWQAGYAAFSVSQSNLDAVRRYIENQEEHHRRMTFQDELRAFCQRHEVEIDERYVWD
jgi:REP element-mobilizing transposase RayT